MGDRNLKVKQKFGLQKIKYSEGRFWMLEARFWMLDAGGQMPDYQIPRFRTEGNKSGRVSF